MDISQFLSGAFAGIPEKLTSAAQWAEEAIPASGNFLTYAKYAGILFLAVFAAGVLIKALFGRRSSLNRALSCGIGICMIYLVTAAVYAWKLHSLESFLAPLPFAVFQGGRMILMPITSIPFNELCRELLGVLVLSFCMNLMDSMIPLGRSALSWIFTRLLVILLSMGLHLLLQWAAASYLPGIVVAYAPAVLLVVLLALVLLGSANILLSLVLTAVNPIIGGIYAFFFSSHLGRQISKALLTTCFVTLFLLAAEKLGYRVFLLTPEAFVDFLPFACIFPLLWYALGHVF